MWLEIIKDKLYRTCSENTYETGTTLFFGENSLNLIDLGKGIVWDSNCVLKDTKLRKINKNFNIFQNLIDNKLESINFIRIFFTHYHIDHRSGIDGFLKFLCQNDIHLKKIPIIIYLSQPKNYNKNIIKKKYYSNRFFETSLEEIQNSINSLKNNTIIFNLRPLHVNGFIAMKQGQKVFINRLIELNNSNFFQLIPCTYLNENEEIISINSTILSFAINPIEIETCNVNLLTKMGSNYMNFDDSYINIEFFNDKSHCFDHTIFKICFKEEKKILIHLGDVFPFCYALSDSDLSNHKKFVEAIRKIKTWVKQCKVSNLGLILTCSHTSKYPNFLKKSNTIPNFFSKKIYQILFHRIKNYCNDLEYFISEKCKLNCQKEYLITHFDNLNDFKREILSSI